MTKVINIALLGAILYLLYLGYFIFFDKPASLAGIASLYIKMGYAYLALFIILILKINIKRK
ncbi:hypothetical protein [Paenibacillus lemnae]|uniref:Uncharacterized protein n=1 Tax=Paenibacillus lemnae TaxID=1330551 RepID=A0A848M6U9_PAELE|nr:hypothetical protein [Paenibacillus lemnae]NMO96707.1 hypothetical protein [Paenibacillus lemnae]